MERKLASVQKVIEVKDHPNADRLDIIQVLGWILVAKKGDFRAGDLCVFCEVDSIMPEDNPEFAFLKPKKYRIKCQKIMGIISQGIAFRTSILPIEAQLGDDVTNMLKITKHEPKMPITMGGKYKDNFPGFIPRTDEIRIQSVPDVLSRHKGKLCQITEKLDGTSFTSYIKDGEFNVCSRRVNYEEGDDNLYWQVARSHGIERKLSKFGFDAAIQGEIIGPKIQKNRYKRDKHELYVFNVYNIGESRYLDYVPMVNLLAKHYIKAVPTLLYKLYDRHVHVLPDNVEDIEAWATGNSKLNNETEKEGIVVRTLKEDWDEEIGRLSFKCINPNYLIKYD